MIPEALLIYFEVFMPVLLGRFPQQTVTTCESADQLLDVS